MFDIQRQSNNSLKGLSLSLLLTSSFTGCVSKQETGYHLGAFSSEDIAQAEQRNPQADKKYTFLKMEDGNLLVALADSNRVRFFRSFGGYTEKGLSYGVLGAGIEADSFDSSVYVEINYLEALAYCNNDWRSFYKAAEFYYQAHPTSLHPDTIKDCLQRLSTPGMLEESKDEDFNHSTSSYGIPWLPNDMRVPVYLQVSPGQLLKIVQKGDDLYFFKNIAGYAVTGLKAHTPFESGGVSIGAEWSSANHYTSVSTNEALALVDHRPKTLIDAVVRQKGVIHGSVEPDDIRTLLAPYSGRNSSTDLADSSFPNSSLKSSNGERVSKFPTEQSYVAYYENHEGHEKALIDKYQFKDNSPSLIRVARKGAILLADSYREAGKFSEIGELLSFIELDANYKNLGLSLEERKLFFNPFLSYFNLDYANSSAKPEFSDRDKKMMFQSEMRLLVHEERWDELRRRLSASKRDVLSFEEEAQPFWDILNSQSQER